ncbi:hypothetical protein KUTeg_001570 [Tegillarca granosa]|uniref:Uncharacterized protein n=1 Tax=Tegillarca granosa TaxID=220873 RepID=A0ABQ9FRT9_TEGGR|nr:hypothetical protein KUTeg_001570 [Tegillarca granosa]
MLTTYCNAPSKPEQRTTTTTQTTTTVSNTIGHVTTPMDPRITTLPTPSSTVTSKTPDPTEADVVLVFHALENKADIDKGKVRVALIWEKH